MELREASGSTNEGAEMTIQEAIKSGKPFRRAKWTSWAILNCDFVVWEYELTFVEFEGDDILATDWEVKP